MEVLIIATYIAVGFASGIVLSYIDNAEYTVEQAIICSVLAPLIFIGLLIILIGRSLKGLRDYVILDFTGKKKGP